MKIAVVGTGTVGVMTVCHFLRYSGNIKPEITCVYNPDKKILGIGESSNVQLPKLLWESINYNIILDSGELDATIKNYVLYKNWRKQDFKSPILPPNYAIHFNNFKLKEFAFKRCKQIYKERFKELHEDVSNLENLRNRFDYVIDCRGWPESYEEYHVSENLLLNKCFAHQIKKPGDWNFTYHQATKNGWMFGIPLQTRQGWGYLFNDRITSDGDALEDLSNILNKKVEKKDVSEFKFKPYRAKKFLENNILKNGNRAIFYEPIEALSGTMYDNINRSFWDYLHGNKSEDQVNTYLEDMSKRYENFICFAYHGGSNFNTKFWKEVKEKTKKHLNNEIWKNTVKHVKNIDYNGEITYPFVPLLWYNLEKGFKYNIFTNPNK
jgi:hypothetical protein